jgi:LacI family transcriptional regulator, galactose operon repressor
MPTIRDVAKRANVSTATVSHVINETRFVSDELRQRVISAMNELGYRRNALAGSLRSGQTHTIGLILPDNLNTFFSELCRGIEEAAFPYGYTLILYNSDNDLEKENLYINFLIEKKVDGIILDTVERDIYALRARIPKSMPIVLIDRDFEAAKFDFILSDNMQGGYLATKHLIDLGHKQIACIKGIHDMKSTVDRLQGFKMAMDESGLSLNQDMIVPGDFRPESGYIAALSLFRMAQPPTAIFAFNDMMAFGVQRAAVELGLRIPDDFSLVGYDDIELSMYTCPALTTISQSKTVIGQKAIQRLIARISDNTLPEVRELVPTNLVIRKSTKKLN